MTESKIEATDRLRQEGRWSEASLYRDRVREELRSGGMKRKEAREAAWIAMFKRFPPLEPEQAEEEFSPEIFTGKHCTLAEAILWAGETVGFDVNPEDAPGPSAWNLRQWVRSGDKAMTAFFTKILPKMMPIRSSLEGEGTEERDSLEQDHNLHRLIEEARNKIHGEAGAAVS